MGNIGSLKKGKPYKIFYNDDDENIRHKVEFFITIYNSLFFGHNPTTNKIDIFYVGNISRIEFDENDLESNFFIPDSYEPIDYNANMEMFVDDVYEVYYKDGAKRVRHKTCKFIEQDESGLMYFKNIRTTKIEIYHISNLIRMQYDALGRRNIRYDENE